MPPNDKRYTYESIPSHDVEGQPDSNGQPTVTKESSTYSLSFAFQLMSATVWGSMSLWGVWIAVFYTKGAVSDWNLYNIVFEDLNTPGFSVAFAAIAIHMIGAAYMALAGAFQLVKFIRKKYPVYHRWVGRFYVLASLIASIGGLIFIFAKGSFGGRQADYAFATYGFIFLASGILTYYYAKQQDYNRHKLWAWRLYSLSLAAWMYRVDYYWWMVFFGLGDTSWLHNHYYQGMVDMWINWAFYVPNLIVVEIVYRWGESATLPTFWNRVLDVVYYVIFCMSVIFSIHASLQLFIPSILGYYNYADGWIM